MLYIKKVLAGTNHFYPFEAKSKGFECVNKKVETKQIEQKS